MSATLPYFDILLDGLRRQSPEVELGFGRHVHWGYWGRSDAPDGTVADFAAAAERMSARVCEAAGARDGQRILDVGCGFGGTIAGLDARLSGVDLVGLNIDARQLERARADVRARPGNKVDFVLGDACALPFPDASFDTVVAVECIFHFPSRARFFREAKRVLKPGGRLALTDFVPIAPAAPLLHFQDLVFGGYVKRVSGPTDIRTTLAEYRKVSAEAGLVPIGEDDITANTIPTYPVVRELIRAIGVHVPTAVAGASALELVSRLGVLRYMLLSYASP
jgi:ubiquinone/menaquinone biosynthesis C-methylase UbiE